MDMRLEFEMSGICIYKFSSMKLIRRDADTCKFVEIQETGLDKGCTNLVDICL
jgi:hypothetical protein